MIRAYTDGAGIGNRIKNLVTALRTAHNSNDRVISFLGIQDYINFNQYSTTFSNVDIGCMTSNLELLPKDSVSKILKKDIPTIYFNPDNFKVYKNQIDHQYHNIEDSMIQEWLRYWALLVVNPRVDELVGILARKFDIQNCVAVQVRSWTDNEWRRNNLFCFDTLVQEMKKFDDSKFFVTSDNEAVTNRLKEIFGSKIISQSFPNERHTLYNKEATLLAFTDMLLASKCPVLIGSYLSTYSECIWWLGHCKAKVIIPHSQSVKTAYKNYYKNTNQQGLQFVDVPENYDSEGTPGSLAYDNEGSLYLCYKENTWNKFLPTKF